MNILVINGPNLNLLGLREPDIYGNRTYRDLTAMLESLSAETGVSIRCMQSNHEGAIVDAIQGALGTADAIVINPAAYTHTSIAMASTALSAESARSSTASSRRTGTPTASSSIPRPTRTPAWRFSTRSRPCGCRRSRCICPM